MLRAGNRSNLRAEQSSRDLDTLRKNTSEAVTNNATAVEELVAKMAEMQAELQRLQLGTAPPGLGSNAASSSSSTNPNAAQREIPYEQRVRAVIGGLGWNTTSDDLLAKAREVCTSIGLSNTQIDAIVAIAGRNGGSTAELMFETPAQLTNARLKVRALNADGLSGRKIFLDAKKTRRELQPARVTHRIHEAFCEMVGNHSGDPALVTKNLAKKSVSYNNVDVGQTIAGGWKWLPASNQWPQEQLSLIKAWAIEEAS